MDIPAAPSQGETLRASWLARLVAAVRAQRLLPGVGYRIHRTANGTTLDIVPDRPDRRVAEAFPWEQLSFGYRLTGNKVWIGTGRLYTPWGVVAVEGSIGADDYAITLTGGPTEYVYVELERGADQGAVGHQTTYPQTAGNTLRYALWSFALVSAGKYRRAGIHHMGDIHVDVTEPDSE